MGSTVLRVPGYVESNTSHTTQSPNTTHYVPSRAGSPLGLGIIVVGIVLAIVAIAGFLILRHYQQLAQQQQNLAEAMGTYDPHYYEHQGQRMREMADAKRKLAEDIAAAHQGLEQNDAKEDAELKARLEAGRVDSEASLAKLKIAREWTFKAGTKRKGKLAGMRDANTALFDFSEGDDSNPAQLYEIPLQNLSEFDQKVVRKAAEN